ncbi:AEC family transporter [Ectothiorhodospiraceae bacterium WFHF3C12]|nr:AEC family transporter [Ectothiorhodospiraceae bacterium WFHF3C12]
MELVYLSLAPIFALIALGYGLRRLGFPGEAAWPALERLVYYVLFPALLVETLGTAEVSVLRGLWVGLAVVTAIGAMAVLTSLLRPLLALDGPAYTSFFQGSIRFNTYVGIAAAIGLFGPEGGAVAAMVMAVMIPLVNVLSVGVLARHADNRTGPGPLVRGIATNPLILGCVAGALLNLSGVGLPGGLDRITGTIGRGALPLGLLTVGAGLSIQAAWRRRGVIAMGSVAKLAVLPLLCLAAARVFALGELEMRVVVLFGALPTATSAYILARQLGGDGPLMAGLLTAQTLAAVLTLPVTLVLLGV